MREDQRNLKDLAGVGPAMLRDLNLLGIHTIEALRRRNPKRMYRDLCRLKGEVQDICCLDVFNAAVAQARDPNLPAEQSQWWFYSKRRKQMLLSILVLAAMLFFQTPALHVSAQQVASDRNRGFQDELLDKLVGEWKLTRKMDRQSSDHIATAGWILNHQFLQLHLKDSGGSQKYEAIVLIGYDNVSERYVAHWIDIFGGRVSETLGYGMRTENSIKFVFEYPDGPFHNTFMWNPETKSWKSLMTTKETNGGWKTFAEDTYHR